MTAEVKAEILIERLRVALNCSQKTIARLILVTDHTLANNKDKPVKEITDPTRGKLSQLYNVVRAYACKGLKPEALFEILEAHVYEDYLGRLDSVSSAISQQKYSQETLLEIAEIAYGRYQQQQEQKFQFLESVIARV